MSTLLKQYSKSVLFVDICAFYVSARRPIRAWLSRVSTSCL